MLHWTSKDAIKESPFASLVLASILIATVAGGITYLV